MRVAEELRYLILAIQREGNRLFAAELRPLGVTPSQAEVLRVLRDHGPLTLSALGELLVCETGTSPSRLVDRMVAQGLVRRDQGSTDRRYVELSLTADGKRLSGRVTMAEERLYQALDDAVGGRPTGPALELLRTLADAFPAGAAVARRRAAQST